MATVTVRNLQKNYGDVQVIPNANVEIDDGQFVVLVGPSGCGKSTLLRMIAGLEDISGGEILIDDRVVNAVEPKERDIAMVFQNYALYPHMNVGQNMSFSLNLRKAPKAEVEERVARAASILGLENLLDRYPRQLSGGQRQRVAMGRAIVRDPKVFLFDEPLSNLDAKLRVQMRAEIKALHQRLRTTTVYVTHDQIEAMTMADKIVVMRAGVVEQVGRPLELYDNPANLFVASFIGSPAMNLLPGTLAENGVRLDGGILLMPVRSGFSSGDNRKVVYGIRPEHIDLAKPGEVGVEAEIELIEPTGAETQIYAIVGGHRVVLVVRERQELQPGDRVKLSIDAAAAHLFDAKTEQRIARTTQPDPVASDVHGRSRESRS